MTRHRTRSEQLYRRAMQKIPGGVNSPVRAFRAVGGDPVFIRRGAGARVWDEDDNEYIDFLGSWGPLILGHAHPEVVEAIHETAAAGTSFGMCTEREVEFAERIADHLPSVEKVRLVSSGTEATMSAVRLARGVTGRDRIVKVEGGFHGHVDALLVRAGSGGATFGVPDSAGVPDALAAATITVPYNDLTAFEALFADQGQQIAAVIVEPVAGNMGVVPPAEGFLQGLRRLTRDAGAVLIFDEVITGFRVGLGGAQGLYGVTPDLTCLGKIIGGGLPVGAYGGPAELMDQVAPDGPVYQAGTLSGNPLAVAAGLRTVQILARDDPYPRLEQLARRLGEGVRAAAREAGLSVAINQVGSMFTTFFSDRAVTAFDPASRCDTALFGRYHGALLERGVFCAPSQFEAGFVSTAHTDEDIECAVAAIRSAMAHIGG